MQERSSLREEDWAGIGVTPRIGFGHRPAVVVVDTTLGFTDPDSPCGMNADAVVDAIRRLIDAGRDVNIPIIFTTLSYDPGERRAAGRFLAKVPVARNLEPGGRWEQIDPRILPASGEPVLHKLWPSAFFGTTLASRLAADAVDTLIVAGLSTSGCVRATVHDGMQLGYRVIVPEDAVGDRNRSAHRANLLDMDAKYADVTPGEEVIDRLRSNAAVASAI